MGFTSLIFLFPATPRLKQAPESRYGKGRSRAYSRDCGHSASTALWCGLKILAFFWLLLSLLFLPYT